MSAKPTSSPSKMQASPSTSLVTQAAVPDVDDEPAVGDRREARVELLEARLLDHCLEGDNTRSRAPRSVGPPCVGEHVLDWQCEERASTEPWDPNVSS